MDSSILKKVALWGGIALLALPFLPGLLPKAVTFERAEQAYRDSGLEVQEWARAASPGLEASEEVRAQISGATVNLYRYTNEGKIAKQLEYQKQDPGSAMVEAWGLAQSLGAAQSHQTPTRSARNGKFMIVATGEDTALLNQIVQIFTAL